METNPQNQEFQPEHLPEPHEQRELAGRQRELESLANRVDSLAETDPEAALRLLREELANMK